MKILNEIIASFYSADFYQSVAAERRGVGVRFVLALTVIQVALITGYFLFYAKTMDQFMAAAPAFTEKLPALAVHGGKLAIDKPVPYNIPITIEDKTIWVVVDTNYQISNVDALRQYMRSKQVVFLLTADSMVTFKPTSDELRIESIAEKIPNDVVITHERWMYLGKMVAEKGLFYLTIAAFVGSLVFLLLYHTVGVMINAGLMMAASGMLKVRLDFPTSLRLAAAMRIPYYAIVCAPLMFGGFFLTGFGDWLVWGVYLIYAIKSADKQGGVWRK